MFNKRLIIPFIAVILILISGCINKENKSNITSSDKNITSSDKNITSSNEDIFDEDTTSPDEDNVTGPDENKIIGSGNNKKVDVHDNFINGKYDNWIVKPKFRSPNHATDNGKDNLIFTVKSGATAGSPDSLTKIYYNARNRLGYGTYTARFKINRVPTDYTDEQVYFGIGLWEFGKKNDQANEVMMGFYLVYNNMKDRWDDRLQVLTRQDGGHSKVSHQDITASDFVNTFHTIEFIYTPDKVVGKFDGKKVLEKTDFIPSSPMSFIIGTRIAQGTPLSSDLDVTFDYVNINANIY